jgi:hemerythrin-like domain-containing protein
MPSTRQTSRANTQSRQQVLTSLKEDHEECEALVQQVLDELTVHAALEEELLYPAARQSISDEELVDEAEVEHESMHALIDQLRAMGPEDEKYVARFTVLCEYVLHHVKEEEGELFPLLEKARLDWEGLAAEISERRQELMPSSEGEGQTEAPQDELVDGQGAERESSSTGRSSAAKSKGRTGKNLGAEVEM